MAAFLSANTDITTPGKSLHASKEPVYSIKHKTVLQAVNRKVYGCVEIEAAVDE
jgi:hypothetical protein